MIVYVNDFLYLAIFSLKFYYTELGHTYWVEGFLQDAVDQYKRAVDINPGKAEYYYYIARSYAEMFDEKDALFYLRKAGCIDSNYFKKARVDNKFDRIKNSREFQELIGIF